MSTHFKTWDSIHSGNLATKPRRLWGGTGMTQAIPPRLTADCMSSRVYTLGSGQTALGEKLAMNQTLHQRNIMGIDVHRDDKWRA